MPEMLATLPSLNAAGKLNSLKRRTEERCADEGAAPSPLRTFEERCAAIDRVFAQDAAALVEGCMRKA